MFEHYEDILLAETLREFFASVKNKKGESYSKSSMINLRAGLNRFLRLPPNNRIINLMHNEVFQNANQVFKGQLRRHKNEGKDVSKRRTDIAPHDLDKLYDKYFTPGLSNGDTEILMQKVFFDLMYFTGRRGKEGLRSLTKKSFDLKTSPDGKEYIEINFNEATKKNQGDSTSSLADNLHNEHAIISEQEGSVRCPVNSFKHYMENLNDKCEAFFQYPNKNKDGYDNKPIGKNSLGSMMKTISEKAKLSKVYTNHCIHKTTATGMHHQGYSLKEIANVTKHKNLQSLEHYIGGPTHDDKEGYSTALFDIHETKRIQQLRLNDTLMKSHKMQSKDPRMTTIQTITFWYLLLKTQLIQKITVNFNQFPGVKMSYRTNYDKLQICSKMLLLQIVTFLFSSPSELNYEQFDIMDHFHI